MAFEMQLMDAESMILGVVCSPCSTGRDVGATDTLDLCGRAECRQLTAELRLTARVGVTHAVRAESMRLNGQDRDNSCCYSDGHMTRAHVVILLGSSSCCNGLLPHTCFGTQSLTMMSRTSTQVLKTSTLAVPSRSVNRMRRITASTCGARRRSAPCSGVEQAEIVQEGHLRHRAGTQA